MSSDSAHQPLYLRASNVAQASDDDVGFWLSLQERMASSCSCNDREQEPPEDDAFWLALQDEMASHINEDVNATDGQGQEIDEHVFADLMGYPQKPQAESERRRGEGSWLQGFASLDDAFAKRGQDGDRVMIPDLVPAVSSDSETEPETDDDDDDSVFSSLPFASDAAAPARRGVSFSAHVEVRTIPHRSSLSSSQRRRMYCSSVEIHRNKQRNRKEFRYDGCDWRNATEEKDMGVDAVTGELVHPAHEHELGLSYDC